MLPDLTNAQHMHPYTYYSILNIYLLLCIHIHSLLFIQYICVYMYKMHMNYAWEHDPLS